MTDVLVRFEHVSKRFRRGELFDSLRDLVPALIRSIGRRPSNDVVDREFWALNDVCLEVRRGETVGVIGHNGAGKSTMLKHLAGVMQPTLGQITVKGRLSALIEVGAGFHPELTGRENVFLNGIILGMSRAETERKFDDIVEFCGLREFIDTPVKRYSSGMYARLGFAVAAHLDPDILVIDEVLSVGDFVFQAKSLAKMQSIARSGATVLFVSHNMRAVADLCARSILMDSGRIVVDGPTSAVIQQYVERESAKIDSARNGLVLVEKVALSGPAGSAVRFDAGTRMRVDISFRARQRCERVAVVLSVLQDNLAQLFHTSTEQLGMPPVDLDAGDTGSASFELDVNLSNGTYYVGAFLYRYDIQKDYDRVVPAATFVVSSAFDHVGPVNLFPQLANFGVRRLQEPAA
jgi:ABC-type polysaccharide/polyol phosphate transport system ATPase subunit